jgi:hypothetical protein
MVFCVDKYLNQSNLYVSKFHKTDHHFDNFVKHSDKPFIEVLKDNFINGIYVKINNQTCFLTCYHNIKKEYLISDTVKINNLILQVYRIIRELDLIIFKVKKSDNILTISLEDVNTINPEERVNIITYDSTRIFEKNIIFKIDQIVSDYIGTTFIPKIPQIKMKTIFSIDEDIVGGDLILQNNRPIGMVCYSNNNYLYGIPLNLIINIFQNDTLFVENKNANLLGYIIETDSGQIENDDKLLNCYFVNKTFNNLKELNENDIIVSIDQQYFDDKYNIKYLDFNVNLQSYLFLKSCIENDKQIEISYFQQIEGNYSSDITNSTLSNPIAISKYNKINLYESNKIVKFLGLTIAELSQEYLINLLKEDIKLEESYYENIIDNSMDNKILFVRNVDYSNVENIKFSKELLKLNAPFVNGIDGCYRLLILKSINSTEIKNLVELEKIIKFEKIKEVIFTYINSIEEILFYLF